ncbi:bifunctional epoxide hydrolase 2 [Brachionichthys hirsutus]|uniref:bifunctional epoxide hydrolase 2 n=1 Tax=Brachionichthys hirsutus TaxID=412623 RepID=UPI0036051DE4
MEDKKKAVLFNFWGVVVPRRQDVFHQFEELHHLPSGFLSSVTSPEDSAMSRAERGEVTLSQLIPAFQEECVKEAQLRAVMLPSDWSVTILMDELREAMMNVHPGVLKTVNVLRHNGLLTTVLANRWIDDSGRGQRGPAHILSVLGNQFDLVLQSCSSGHKVPESSLFSSALKHLGVTSKQALWLDADEEGVKAAEGAGIKAILVKDVGGALSRLSSFTGVQAVGPDSPPPSCSPDKVSHGYVSIRPGVRTHYVDMGSGPPVLLCHGFPESWFSWRYQIPALAAAGFRVLALDMKGYGESTAPPDIEEYSAEQLCKDLIIFMDKMMIPRVTLVGHDWGGFLVWNVAQVYPERVRAVASLNTPLFRADPAGSAAQALRSIPVFDYQNYFQKPGVAEAELQKDLDRTFKIFFYSSAEEGTRPPLKTAGVCARGGLFVDLPEEIPRSSILTEADLRYYVSRYQEQGFRRPLNWYRNGEPNFRWRSSFHSRKLLMPALMVTAGRDPVLLPAFSKGMEDLIPNLSRRHIEDCGHWTQMERPTETNNILVAWLQETHRRQDHTAEAPRL